MPLGVGIAIGVVGGVIGGTALGGKDSKAAGVNSPTQSFTDAASKSTPPNAIQSASNATQQASIAATKQKKKAAVGDTLLTPQSAPGASGTPTAAPKTLIGS